jgi:hypothetical protein
MERNLLRDYGDDRIEKGTYTHTPTNILVYYNYTDRKIELSCLYFLSCFLHDSALSYITHMRIWK